MINKLKIIGALIALFVVPVTVILFVREIRIESVLLRVALIAALVVSYLAFSTWVIDRVEKWRQK